MKSTEKKTPEKKPSSEAEVPQENAQEQEASRPNPLEKLRNLNNFAWFRIFRFGNLLCKSG
jgi:hypothetical protein